MIDISEILSNEEGNLFQVKVSKHLLYYKVKDNDIFRGWRRLANNNFAYNVESVDSVTDSRLDSFLFMYSKNNPRLCTR